MLESFFVLWTDFVSSSVFEKYLIFIYWMPHFSSEKQVSGQNLSPPVQNCGIHWSQGHSPAVVTGLAASTRPQQHSPLSTRMNLSSCEDQAPNLNTKIYFSFKKSQFAQTLHRENFTQESYPTQTSSSYAL